MIPLPIPSLLANSEHAIRDNWDLEFGADLLHWSYDFGVPGQLVQLQLDGGASVVGVMWNLWFTRNFAIYPKLELGYAFGWFSDWNNGSGANQPAYGGFFIAGDAGALYKLDNGLTLRAEVGSDGLKLGAGWLLFDREPQPSKAPPSTRFRVLILDGCDAGAGLVLGSARAGFRRARGG